MRLLKIELKGVLFATCWHGGVQEKARRLTVSTGGNGSRRLNNPWASSFSSGLEGTGTSSSAAVPGNSLPVWSQCYLVILPSRLGEHGPGGSSSWDLCHRGNRSGKAPGELARLCTGPNLLE